MTAAAGQAAATCFVPLGADLLDLLSRDACIVNLTSLGASCTMLCMLGYTSLPPVQALHRLHCASHPAS